MNYILAGVQPWNIENFKLLKKKDSGSKWLLIQDKNSLNIQKVKLFNPRYIFFPHWSWIIPREIWSEYDCVVFHMTDLPYGRGGTPLQNLILRGHKATKISALKVNGGIDEGDIYLKANLSLTGSANQIYRRASKIIFTKMIPYIMQNEPIPKKQSGKVTEFQRRKPGDSRMLADLGLKGAYDFIRMLDADGYPKAFIETQTLRFEFKKAKLAKGKLSSQVEVYEK